MTFLDNLITAWRDATREPAVPLRRPLSEPMRVAAPVLAPTRPRPTSARLRVPRASTAGAPEHATAQNLRAALGSRAELRRALLLREILGPPVSVRNR